MKYVPEVAEKMQGRVMTGENQQRGPVNKMSADESGSQRSALSVLARIAD